MAATLTPVPICPFGRLPVTESGGDSDRLAWKLALSTE